jgi:hypothetical protein
MKLARIHISETLSYFSTLREGLLRDCQQVIRRHWLRYKAKKAAREAAE